MEDIHLPSKRKLEGDDSIVPMKRGRDGLVSQPPQNGHHDMIKHSTQVAIQNSIILIKKLFRDLHALVANLFAVGSDGYLTLYFLHLYRDIVLTYNVEVASADRLRKSCASGYIFEIFSFFWPEEKMQSLLPFHDAFKCGLALELGYILAVACRELESTFYALRNAVRSDEDLSPAEQTFIGSIAHSDSSDPVEVLLTRSRIFSKINGGSLQRSGSNFKKRVLQTAPFVCKRYDEFNFVEIHSILRGEQLCCINEQYLSDFQPLIDFLVARSVTVQSPETLADDTAMHCDPEPVVSQQQPAPTVEASDVALVFNIASVKSRLPEIEAAIKAYPFRQPRDEQAALEGMAAIVRDLENGNIKSREDLHKRCMRFNTGLPGDCLPIRGLIYRVFDLQAGRLGVSLGQAAHGFKIKPALEATDSMRPSMMAYHQRGARGSAATGKQTNASAPSRSTQQTQQQQQQVKSVSKINGTNSHANNGTVTAASSSRADPKPPTVTKKPATIAIDTSAPANAKEPIDEAPIATDGNKDGTAAATTLSAISPKTPTAAPVPLSAMNFTQMATHFNSSLTNEQKLAYWHSAVRLISSTLTPPQMSAIKDALSLQSTGDRFNSELLAAKWGISVDDFQGVLKRVKSARSRVLHDKVRQLINAGSYPVPRDFSTWKKALDAADAAERKAAPPSQQSAATAPLPTPAPAAPTVVPPSVSDEKSSTETINHSASNESLSSASSSHPVVDALTSLPPLPPPAGPAASAAPASSTTTEKAGVTNVASKSPETIAMASGPAPSTVTSPPKESSPMGTTDMTVPLATVKSPEVVTASASNGHPTPEAYILNTSISPTVPKQPTTPTTSGTTPGGTGSGGVGASTDGMISVRLVYDGNEVRRETAKVKPTKKLSTFIESLRKHRNLVGTVQLWRDTQLLSGSDSLQTIGVREGDVLTVRVIPPP